MAPPSLSLEAVVVPDPASPETPPVAPHIASLVAYPPGKPIEEVERELGITGVVKLASNENPLGPSPAAMHAIEAALPKLALYPDGSGFYLKRALAERTGVPPEGILLGNGSNELLELLVRTFVRDGETALSSDATFIVYKLACQQIGRQLVQTSLTPGHGYDLEAMASRVDETTKMVFVANPNNPTGTHLGADAFGRFVDAIDAEAATPPILVIDEAYLEYVDAPDHPDALALLARRPNTVVMRTFSKAYGLAGLRCGYALTSPELAGWVNRVRAPFNVNSLALVGCEAALGDTGHVEAVVGLALREKARVGAALEALGVGVVPSQTNFLLCDFAPVGFPDAGEVFQRAMAAGVILRPMKAYGLPSMLRITVGTEAEDDRLVTALRDIVASGPQG